MKTKRLGMKIFNNTIVGLTLCCSVFLSSAAAEIIGISFPNFPQNSWQKHGQYLQDYLEEDGYGVSYMPADNVKNQISDIRSMIDSGCDVLVVASIEDKALSKVLDEAKQKNITVIAYDKLIMNSDAVDYYVTFDHYSEGVKKAQYLVDKFNLNERKRRLNVEFFSGAASDNVARDIYNGEMSVLEPYFESGILGCLSFETDFEQTSSRYWNGTAAQRRLRHIISLSQYRKRGPNKKLDIIMSSGNDIPEALKKTLTREYGYKKNELPFISGQDCTDESLSQIKNGQLPMCVFKDTETLAYMTKVVVDRVTNKGFVTFSENSSYFNGVDDIPTYILPVSVVDRNNVDTYLATKEKEKNDSGNYSL